jgi:hypothetical protein
MTLLVFISVTVLFFLRRTIQRLFPLPGGASSTSMPKEDGSAATTTTEGGRNQHARAETKLPPGWKKHHDPTYDQHFYFHEETEGTSWVHPEGSYDGSTGVGECF